MRRERVLRDLVLTVIAVWTAYSLSGLLLLDRPLPVQVATPPLVGLAGLGIVLYAVAAARCYRVCQQRRRPLLASVIIAFALLAEAMIAMLNEYFEVAVPMVANQHGGNVDKLIGDAIMVTFNTHGDQPDHTTRATRAGLALQQETARSLRVIRGGRAFASASTRTRR
jgi:hypothetical protein